MIFPAVPPTITSTPALAVQQAPPAPSPYQFGWQWASDGNTYAMAGRTIKPNIFGQSWLSSAAFVGVGTKDSTLPALGFGLSAEWADGPFVISGTLAALFPQQKQPVLAIGLSAGLRF